MWPVSSPHMKSFVLMSKSVLFSLFGESLGTNRVLLALFKEDDLAFYCFSSLPRTKLSFMFCDTNC